MSEHPAPPGEHEAFDRYHRRVGLAAVRRRALLVLVAGTAAVLLGAAVATSPGARPPAVMPASVGQPFPPDSAAPVTPAAASAPASPSVAAPALPAPAPLVGPAGQPEAAPAWTPRSPILFAPVADARPADGGSWTIPISLAGYQAEVDQCVWVRMDLNAAAPIVGAHNNCGGEIVLEMQEGDRVTLSGYGLDGDFIVTGSRDAFAGDVASEATEGMTADVLLQTCYFTADGRMRLVTLAAAGGSIPLAE